MTEFRLAAGDDSRESRKRRKSSRRSSKSSRRASKRRSSSIRNVEGKTAEMEKMKKEKRAQGRQRALDWLHFVLLGLQLIALIGIVCGAVVMYNMMSNEEEPFYYLIQSMIELVMFVVAGMTICYANSFFRICLLSGHLCAATFAFFLAKTTVETQNAHYKCWNAGPKCIWVWPLEFNLHLVYLGISAGFAHILLGLISLMVIFFYEGSLDHQSQKETGYEVLEKILAEEMVHRNMHHKIHHKRESRRKRSSKQSQKSQKSGPMQVHLPKGAAVKHKKETKRMQGVTLDASGKPNGYGVAVTEVKTIICDTPTYTAKRVKSKSEVVSVKDKKPKMENKAKVSQTSSKTSQTDSTKTTQKPGKFNSISKMPALESPIAYLNRREKENDKKSSYAF